MVNAGTVGYARKTNGAVQHTSCVVVKEPARHSESLSKRYRFETGTKQSAAQQGLYSIL